MIRRESRIRGLEATALTPLGICYRSRPVSFTAQIHSHKVFLSSIDMLSGSVVTAEDLVVPGL